MSRARPLISLMLPTAVTLSLVACSDDDSGDTTTTAAEAEDSTTTEPTTGDTSAVIDTESFEADGWTYTLTSAELRSSEEYAGSVLDLTFSAVTKPTTPSLAGSLVVTVEMEGETTTNCVADVDEPTPPGESVDVVVSCGLSAFSDPALEDLSISITDLSDEAVFATEL